MREDMTNRHIMPYHDMSAAEADAEAARQTGTRKAKPIKRDYTEDRPRRKVITRDYTSDRPKAKPIKRDYTKPVSHKPKRKKVAPIRTVQKANRPMPTNRNVPPQKKRRTEHEEGSAIADKKRRYNDPQGRTGEDFAARRADRREFNQSRYDKPPGQSGLLQQHGQEAIPRSPRMSEPVGGPPPDMQALIQAMMASQGGGQAPMPMPIPGAPQPMPGARPMQAPQGDMLINALRALVGR